MKYEGVLRDCYQMARSWNIPPHDFWAMSLREWFWEFDFRRADASKAALLADEELWASIGEKAPYH